MHALRVLKFENLPSSTYFKLMKLPEEIGNLIHLRLLSLRDTYIERLPSSIAKLRCMQTLDLRVKTFCSSNISNMLWKLEQLRYLYLPRDYLVSDKKLRLGNLTSLQTLVNILTKHFNVNDLVKFISLKKLKIYVATNMGEKILSLQALH